MSDGAPFGSGLALRPGVAQGSYPERGLEHESWFSRALRLISGATERALSLRRAPLEQFVSQVRSRGAKLRGLDEAQLAEELRRTRERLVLEGTRDDLLPGCFALISEFSRRTLGMEPYDVQLMAGWIMARGKLAEMATGEGKTLAATLPACTAALAGIPVHVISANDYLVARDAAKLAPLYEALGLSVSAVTEDLKNPNERRDAYSCDITYGTTKQIAFDYLRDGLARGRTRGKLKFQLDSLHNGAAHSGLLLRGLCFAIIDEADAILIDEASTPLILAGAGGSPEQERTYRQALRLAQRLEDGLDYRLNRMTSNVELSEGGRMKLEELTRPLSVAWHGPRRREAWALQALRALHVFVRDQHYLVRDGHVEIIDQPTGRSNPDRSWERGLHQLIELKEGCELTPERETLARISCQRFYRRYLKLSGMTGTAREVAGEVQDVYGLATVPIPTRKPLIRQHFGTRVYPSKQSKWRALSKRVAELNRTHRPVLVGTSSLGESEVVSRLLTAAGIEHRVLNARQDAEEAQIVADAGQLGRITVATNMAGRGTDIALGTGVAESGGLHVISTQRSSAGRIDRQLYGRSGRQGDPGSCEGIFSLEDDPLVQLYPDFVRRLMTLMSRRRGFFPHRLGSGLTSLPQCADERRQARIRRSLMETESYLSDLLAFTGQGE
ncbi:MAG: prepilin peptidase [bacterium]|nr:prepilin peptidase [bacterium]